MNTRDYEGDTAVRAEPEFVRDQIGKAELDRLRSLLSHSGRADLTTWEVVEIAADDLVMLIGRVAEMEAQLAERGEVLAYRIRRADSEYIYSPADVTVIRRIPAEIPR